MIQALGPFLPERMGVWVECSALALGQTRRWNLGLCDTHVSHNPNARVSRTKTVLTAQAEAEKIRFIGEAEAASIEAVGKAEAEKMRLKAEAYQQYGEAAKTALVLEALPKVHAGPAAALSCCTSLSRPFCGTPRRTEEPCVSSAVRPQQRFLSKHLCVFRSLARWLRRCPEPMRSSF